MKQGIVVNPPLLLSSIAGFAFVVVSDPCLRGEIDRVLIFFSTCENCAPKQATTCWKLAAGKVVHLLRKLSLQRDDLSLGDRTG